MLVEDILVAGHFSKTEQAPSHPLASFCLTPVPPCSLPHLQAAKGFSHLLVKAQILWWETPNLAQNPFQEFTLSMPFERAFANN